MKVDVGMKANLGFHAGRTWSFIQGNLELHPERSRRMKRAAGTYGQG
jgi:hypothetical protein